LTAEVLSKETTPSIVMGDSCLDPQFKDEIRRLCGEKVLECYQCGECTAGCPAAFAMDVTPNQVIRMAQLGMKDDVLATSAIWLCAGCETCATRCPKGVSLSRIMDACRQIAVESGTKPKELAVVQFHEEFLNEVKRNGRVHELGLVAMYKMRTRNFFADVFQGIQMFMKGKLAVVPTRIKGTKEVRGLFRK
jgi:heterodisulfide reductase subunit C2